MLGSIQRFASKATRERDPLEPVNGRDGIVSHIRGLSPAVEPLNAPSVRSQLRRIRAWRFPRPRLEPHEEKFHPRPAVSANMSVAEPVRSLCDPSVQAWAASAMPQPLCGQKSRPQSRRGEGGRFIESRPAQSMAVMFLILDCHPVLQIEACQDAGFERKASEMVMGAGVARECRFCLWEVFDLALQRSRKLQYRGNVTVGN